MLKCHTNYLFLKHSNKYGMFGRILYLHTLFKIILYNYSKDIYNLCKKYADTLRRIKWSFILISAYAFTPLRQQTPALRHPCIRLKPAPKGDRHVDVYPAVLSRCNPRTPSVGDYSHEETISLGKRTLNGKSRSRNLDHTGSLLHVAFGIWMKTQPFHLEVNNIRLYI